MKDKTKGDPFTKNVQSSFNTHKKEKEEHVSPHKQGGGPI